MDGGDDAFSGMTVVNLIEAAERGVLPYRRCSQMLEEILKGLVPMGGHFLLAEARQGSPTTEDYCRRLVGDIHAHWDEHSRC